MGSQCSTESTLVNTEETEGGKEVHHHPEQGTSSRVRQDKGEPHPSKRFQEHSPDTQALSRSGPVLTNASLVNDSARTATLPKQFATLGVRLFADHLLKEGQLHSHPWQPDRQTL